MKIFVSLMLLVALSCIMLVSCSKLDNNDSQIGGVTAPSTGSDINVDVEEDSAWPIFSTINCTLHHRDYHLIPYHLVKFVGIDESNEWAEKAKESLDENAAEGVCCCPDFNIKNYIDSFDVSEEDFIVYGDRIYYATLDTEILYGMTPEEIDEYFIYSESLIDLTITSQHFEFIEKHFKYEYYSTLANMVIYDEGSGTGIYPSVPTLVQTLGISRSALETILNECTENNISVYGRSYNFEYDLDFIYNPDGSFKELPTYEGMSEYLREMKLNRIFCGIDG